MSDSLIYKLFEVGFALAFGTQLGIEVAKAFWFALGRLVGRWVNEKEENNES